MPEITRRRTGEMLRQLFQILLPEPEGIQARERVAELRRELPEGATIQDYEFIEGPTSLDEGDEPVRKVKLSELFTAPERSLVIYHYCRRSHCRRISDWP